MTTYISQEQVQPCIGKDPLCPCQDGDACHYKDAGDTKALPVKVEQAKQIADYAKIIEAIRNNPLADNGTLGAFLRGLAENITGESFPSVESPKAKQIEALQAEADYWRARYAALAKK